MVRAVPQFAHLGPLFKSAEPLLLTEEETEYNISVVVHVFEAHVLLQFNCSNTVQEQVLENVSVNVDLAEAVRSPLTGPPAPLRNRRLCPVPCHAWPGLCGMHQEPSHQM